VTSVLSIDRVSKLYGTSRLGGSPVPALRRVSFDISAGEVVTLIGESGSGKTTLGRIVLRLASATSGHVTFDGQDISAFSGPRLREYYRHVQGVFQDPFSSYNPIFRADRVFELVRSSYFGNLPRPQWQDKIEAALHAVALNPGDVLGRYPHQLSGGQQQRLLIARALLLNVRLLVADEIISMLDASTRVDILNLLVSLKRSGLAILFITHDLSLGNYVSDRTVILRRGAIVEMGDTVEVFGNPRHPYTRDLLAAVPELHKKWHPPADAAETGHGDRPARGDVPVSGEGIPAGNAADARPAAPPVPPRRTRCSTRAPVPVRALDPPPLISVGPGHLVAAGEP
jgi:oligopeptide/dipeptide ABC transporter ATP-binding protein